MEKGDEKGHSRMLADAVPRQDDVYEEWMASETWAFRKQEENAISVIERGIESDARSNQLYASEGRRPADRFVQGVRGVCRIQAGGDYWPKTEALVVKEDLRILSVDMQSKK
ncbi:hypothetical protein RB195_018646 [Necator americanus]|uniref:Uncharacterized protein n=1 Tax=Necator americanus TaxID=51031 RepID=A0ABR1CAP5_NECAM